MIARFVVPAVAAVMFAWESGNLLAGVLLLNAGMYLAHRALGEPKVRA